MATRPMSEEERVRQFAATHMPTSGGGFVRRAFATTRGGAGVPGGTYTEMLPSGGLFKATGAQPTSAPSMLPPAGPAVPVGATRQALLGGGQRDLASEALGGSQIALTQLSKLAPGATSARQRFLSGLSQNRAVQEQRQAAAEQRALDVAAFTERERNKALIPAMASIEREKISTAGRTSTEQAKLAQEQKQFETKLVAERDNLQKQGKFPGTPEFDMLFASKMEQDAERERLKGNTKLADSLQGAALKANLDLIMKGAQGLVGEEDLTRARQQIESFLGSVGGRQGQPKPAGTPAGPVMTGGEGGEQEIQDVDGKPGISLDDRDFNDLTADINSLDKNDPNNAAQLARYNKALSILKQKMGV